MNDAMIASCALYGDPKQGPLDYHGGSIDLARVVAVLRVDPREGAPETTIYVLDTGVRLYSPWHFEDADYQWRQRVEAARGARVSPPPWPRATKF